MTTDELPSELKGSGLLNVNQVAILLDVSHDTVTKAILRGQIKAVKLGSGYKVGRAEVRRLLRDAGAMEVKGKGNTKVKSNVS
jgi:excisionase family DNA binding protein